MRHVSRNSVHYITLRWRYDHDSQCYLPEWTCVSEWDMPDGGRLRRTMFRSTSYHDEKQVRRWARKYNVSDVPMVTVQGCEP